MKIISVLGNYGGDASDAMPEGSVKTITGIVINVPRLTRNEESADRIPEA